VSLIIDAIKKAQQLRLKELKEAPFLKRYGPKGTKGAPKTKRLAFLFIFGSAALLILLLRGDTFLSLFIPDHKQNIALVEKERPLELPQTEEKSQDLKKREASEARIERELSSKAFFIDVKEEEPLTKQKPGKKKKKTYVLQASPVEPLKEEKPSPLTKSSIGAKEKSIADPSNQKETDSLVDKVAEENESLPLPLAEQMPQETLSPSSKEEEMARPLSKEEEGEKIRTPGSDVIKHFNLGVEFHHRREISKAARAYQEVIEMDPAYVEAYNNLGIIYQEIGNFDRALETYIKAIEINPRYEKTLNNLGILFMLKNRYDEAIEAFQKAIHLNPNNSESHTHLGVLFKKRGQVDKAIESYQKALTLNPLSGETHYNIGLLHEQLEHLDLAINHYQRFIQLSSKTHPELVGKVKRHLNYLTAIKK
jgi:tetratricopeptide (TPR) repeat protein